MASVVLPLPAVPRTTVCPSAGRYKTSRCRPTGLGSDIAVINRPRPSCANERRVWRRSCSAGRSNDCRRSRGRRENPCARLVCRHRGNSRTRGNFPLGEARELRQDRFPRPNLATRAVSTACPGLSASLPRSFFHWIFGLVRRSPAPFFPPGMSSAMKGRMLRRTPSSMSGAQPTGCSSMVFQRTKMSKGGFALKDGGEALSVAPAPRPAGLPRRLPHAAHHPAGG